MVNFKGQNSESGSMWSGFRPSYNLSKYKVKFKKSQNIWLSVRNQMRDQWKIKEECICLSCNIQYVLLSPRGQNETYY
jgi:hypothetical protein